MEIITPPLQVFMAKLQRYEPASRDSTAVMAAKTCMRLYFYQIVLGFRPDERDTPVYFRWGSAYHKFREVLEKTNGDLQLALTAAANIWKDYQTPAESKWSHLTGPRLLESLQLAYAEWQKEKQLARIEVLAVEQAFEVYMSDGKTRRGGKADQFIRWNGRLWGRDFKTSSKTPKYYEQGIDPNDQFTGYIWGLSKLSGEFVQGLIVDVLFNEKDTKSQKKHPEIKQFTTTRTQGQLERWEKEHILLEKKIALSREEDTWEQQEKSCSFCIFRSVCTKGSEAAMMNQLQANFVQKPWDYKTLGEVE